MGIPTYNYKLSVCVHAPGFERTSIDFVHSVHVCHGSRFDMSQQENAGVIDEINDGFIPFVCASPRVQALCMLTHWQGLLAHLRGTEPPVMSLVTPVLFLL